MNAEIINTPFTITIYGFSGIADNEEYAKTAFKLMDKMWAEVKTHQLKHKGINIWVYDENRSVFAGVELETVPIKETQLEVRTINLPRYAYYKHIGPYQLIKSAGTAMTNELTRLGEKTGLPYIEIYGHWNSDETKLETKLLMSLLPR